MEKQRNDVISMLRSCLVSTKGRIPLRQLDNDYRTLVGTKIPFAQLGFQKLEDLIQSEPTLLIDRQPNGDIYVDAKSTEKTSHISEMVGKQKALKKKRFVPQRQVRFHNDSNNYRPAQTARWRPKEMTNKYPRKFQTSSRPAAVSHNQFVNYNTHKIPSKIVIPETSTFAKQSPNIQNNTQSTPKFDIKDRLVVNPVLPAPTLSNERSVANNGHTISFRNTAVESPELPCTSLASTRRRLTRKMSELVLDRDSDNSSPTGEITTNASNAAPVVVMREKTPDLPRFLPSGNPVEDLKNFVNIYKIGKLEVSSNKVMKQKWFTCKIKVGKHTFTSYPQEFPDPKAAEKFCSEEAFKELTKIYPSKRKSLLLSSYKDILNRIPPMLEKHNHGIWVWQLELDYADKFNENLPVDWLKIIDSSPCIQVEKCSNNYVIRHCQPGDALQKGQKWSTFMNITDVSVPSNTVQFGDDSKLYAQVTCVMSANEIWCRQMGTEESGVFEEMLSRMEEFYQRSHSTLRVESITEAGYYVANFENGWHRIRAVVVGDVEVQCFFIDYGDETDIAKGNIYKLQREFASSQAQAFVCRLAGLEELYETSVNSESLQNILQKQVVLELAPDNIISDLSDVSMPVYMYDYVTGNSVNEELIPLLTIESASPTLQKDSVMEVYVSNIENNGDIYIQMHSRGYESLQELLHNLETQILQHPPKVTFSPVTKQNSRDKMFFGKYKVDGHWYRMKIIDWSPKEDLAQIYFVDYGNTDVVNVNREVLYPLDKLSDVLNQYPCQAVKVRMTVSNIPDDFKELANQEMPVDVAVLLKFVEYDNEGVPWVEFFKRNADGGLFCINKSIEMKDKLKGDGNNNTKSGKRKLVLAQYDGLSKNVPSGGVLKRPTLPNKGAYLEVHVPFAVNPWNFFVQPLDSREQLYSMMEKLQEKYKDVQYSPLQTEDIIPGRIYASKHDDGIWYRTSVIKVIHSGSISVFYCDFGYYANLTVQQLIPLDLEFMELPYQALKAKLADIKPKQNKWTMEDCEDFKELVEKQHFYSVLRDIEKDELYESDIVLKLILVDTSSPEIDIYIGKELIKKGRAVEV